jgi:hypothetical protein
MMDIMNSIIVLEDQNNIVTIVTVIVRQIMVHLITVIVTVLATVIATAEKINANIRII